MITGTDEQWATQYARICTCGDRFDEHICRRVLFITRDGLWPRHINVGRPLCVASDTVARGVRVRGVLGG